MCSFYLNIQFEGLKLSFCVQMPLHPDVSVPFVQHDPRTVPKSQPPLLVFEVLIIGLYCCELIRTAGREGRRLAKKDENFTCRWNEASHMLQNHRKAGDNRKERNWEEEGINKRWKDDSWGATRRSVPRLSLLSHFTSVLFPKTPNKFNKSAASCHPDPSFFLLLHLILHSPPHSALIILFCCCLSSLTRVDDCFPFMTVSAAVCHSVQ